MKLPHTKLINFKTISKQMTNQRTSDDGNKGLKLSKKLHLSKHMGCIQLKQHIEKYNLNCLLKNAAKIEAERHQK